MNDAIPLFLAENLSGLICEYIHRYWRRANSGAFYWPTLGATYWCLMTWNSGSLTTTIA